MITKEGQYKIGDIEFGKGTMIQILNVESISYDITPGDRPLPMSDEIRFTKDYVKPGVIQFGIAVLNNRLLESVMDEFSDLDTPIHSGTTLLEDFKKEWRADEIRSQWGWVKPLHYKAVGQRRVVYGRPRNFASDRLRDKVEWFGITCSYQLADSLSYDEDYNYSAILPTTGSTPGGSIARGGGKAPSWIEAYVIGPCSSPVITLGPYVITLNYNIPAGQIVEINSYPWTRRAITSTGVNIGHLMIGSSPYLEDIRFPAGANWDLQLKGSGTNANTRLLVQWQEAHYAL